MFRSAHKKVLIIIAILALLVGVFELIKKDSSQSAPVAAEKTLTGKTTCLPHKDSSGPQTMECAFGIKAGGDYYALSLNNLSADDSAALNASQGEVSVTGVVVPIEAISADTWQRYDVKGIMEVGSWKEIE